jgi:hypothetical protein
MNSRLIKEVYGLDVSKIAGASLRKMKVLFLFEQALPLRELKRNIQFLDACKLFLKNIPIGIFILHLYNY